MTTPANVRNQPKERAANRFARELLMPEDEFVRLLQYEHYDLDQLVQHFQVPSMAVRLRAAELGLKVKL